jgi:hypothetical protein
VRSHRGCDDLGYHRLVEDLAAYRRYLCGPWLEKGAAGSSTALSATL